MVNAKIKEGNEKITGGVANINTDHAAIHLGYGALASDVATIASLGTKAYCITTPVALYPHFKNIGIKTLGGSCALSIVRNVTVTDNSGDDILITNPNDNSELSPTMTIKEDPTYTGGDVWDTVYALSDSTNQTVGNAETAQSVNQELVMKNENTEYILLITNLSTETIQVAWQGFWYEEPQGVVL